MANYGKVSGIVDSVCLVSGGQKTAQGGSPPLETTTTEEARGCDLSHIAASEVYRTARSHQTILQGPHGLAQEDRNAHVDLTCATHRKLLRFVLLVQRRLRA